MDTKEEGICETDNNNNNNIKFNYWVRCFCETEDQSDEKCSVQAANVINHAE